MPRLAPALMLLALSAASAAAGPSAPPAAAERVVPAGFGRPSLELNSGYLWKITSPNATHPYRLNPWQLTFRAGTLGIRELGRFQFGIRNTVTLLGDAVLGGPESRYLGLSFRPTFELWDTASPLVLYAGLGGGFGWFDTRGVDGGQSQDFTFNILGEFGARWRLDDRWALTLGAQYQHNSNHGLKAPNPGLNTFGPMLGVQYTF